MPPVFPGLHVLLENPALIGGRPWALLANHAAVTQDLDPARGALLGAGVGPLARLFAPEHGLEGLAQEMEAVAHQVDPLTGAPVSSLYGQTAASLEPRAEDLEGVRVVVVDLPDIGTRYCTFAATMDAMMATCARVGVEVIVLDRPNPISGLDREGGLVRPGFESFVSRIPTPVRHGLTLGEVALLLRRKRYPDLELTVVRCRGWERSMWWEATGLPWVPPSPNMPAVETAALYPGLCLAEATNLSEGRGTTRPFQLVGAPWVDAVRLLARLRDQAMPGIALRPARFRPEFQKHAGEICHGIELHVVERDGLRPLETGLRLLQAVRDLHPRSFDWRDGAYEFVEHVPAIDLLTGSGDARRALETGQGLDDVLAAWRAEARAFAGAVDDLLLYR